MGHLYKAFYCEENIWQLAREPRFAGAEVSVITNPEGTALLWSQRAGSPPDGAVVWDYHVILVAPREGGGHEVWDLDTVLGCPVDFERYFAMTFGDPARVPQRYRPWFRVMPAERYGALLGSDRGHMRDEAGGWRQPPPPWEPPGGPVALMELLDLSRPEPGEVLDVGRWWGRYRAQG